MPPFLLMRKLIVLLLSILFFLSFSSPSFSTAFFPFPPVCFPGFAPDPSSYNRFGIPTRCLPNNPSPSPTPSPSPSPSPSPPPTCAQATYDYTAVWRCDQQKASSLGQPSDYCSSQGYNPDRTYTGSFTSAPSPRVVRSNSNIDGFEIFSSTGARVAYGEFNSLFSLQDVQVTPRPDPNQQCTPAPADSPFSPPSAGDGAGDGGSGSGGSGDGGSGSDGSGSGGSGGGGSGNNQPPDNSDPSQGCRAYWTVPDLGATLGKLRDKFPLDLFSFDDQAPPPSEECPELTLWGQTIQFCFLRDFTRTAKYLIWISLLIRSILSL